MEKIRARESTHPDGLANSSYHPLLPPRRFPEEVTTPNRDAAAQGYLPGSSLWLPCHYFDYMGGTSTGGYTYLKMQYHILTNFHCRLIAIMLGRLHMSIDDCISEYETLGERVFAHPRWFHIRSPMIYPRDKYRATDLEDVLKDVVSRHVSGGPHFPGGKNFALDETDARCT